MFKPEESILGIDFGGTKVALRVVHPDGSVRNQRLKIGAGEDAHSVIDRTLAAAVDLGHHVAAAGISTPGIVHDERVDLAPNVVGWSDLSLTNRLREGLGAREIVVENDVKAAALAEVREGQLRGVDSGLYVNLGTGIAIAPIIAGEVVRGAHGASGEIGYGVVGTTPDFSGTGAPLEEFAGGGGLTRRIRESSLGIDSVAALVELATTNREAAELWASAIEEIARHLLTAALTVDPSRIILGGGMVRAGDALMVPLSERLVGALPYPPTIAVSAFGHDAALSGALILANDRLKKGA